MASHRQERINRLLRHRSLFQIQRLTDALQREEEAAALSDVARAQTDEAQARFDDLAAEVVAETEALLGALLAAAPAQDGDDGAGASQGD